MTLRELDDKCTNAFLYIKLNARWIKVTSEILSTYGDRDVSAFNVWSDDCDYRLYVTLEYTAVKEFEENVYEIQG